MVWTLLNNEKFVWMTPLLKMAMMSLNALTSTDLPAGLRLKHDVVAEMPGQQVRGRVLEVKVVQGEEWPVVHLGGLTVHSLGSTRDRLRGG